MSQQLSPEKRPALTSIAFPHMFTQRNTNVVTDKDATTQNLILTLQTRRRSLFGDPFYGTNLFLRLYEQNDPLLADLVVDDIYESILTFLPQIWVQRKDIKVYGDGYHLYANIRARNLLDYQTNMYHINLTGAQASEGGM